MARRKAGEKYNSIALSLGRSAVAVVNKCGRLLDPDCAPATGIGSHKKGPIKGALAVIGHQGPAKIARLHRDIITGMCNLD